MTTETHAILYQSADGTLSLGMKCKTPECAAESVPLFEGAHVLGTVALLPEPVSGMSYRLAAQPLIAELGQEVGAVESFRGSLNSWIMAYPEQCFSEPQPEELFWLRDAKPGLLDRISASMGRHVAKCLINDFDAAFSNFTTSPAHTSEARDAALVDELVQASRALQMAKALTSLPLKNEFAKRNGMASHYEVEAWMLNAHRRFDAALAAMRQEAE